MSSKLMQVGNEHGLMIVPSPRPQRSFENPAGGNVVPAAQQNGGPGPDREQPLIARYGSLLPKYYKFLEQLPPDALPVTPPASKHLYHITRGYDAARINITVYLKTSTIIVNHPRKDPWSTASSTPDWWTSYGLDSRKGHCDCVGGGSS